MRKLYFLLTALVFIACDQGNVPNASLQIMPLKVGNQWIGQIVSLDANDNILDTRPDTLAVSSSTTYDGDVWYYVKELPGQFFYSRYDTSVWIYSIRADGLYANIGPSFFGITERLAKYPARIEDSVYSTGLISPDSSSLPDSINASKLLRYVKRNDEVISVPGGTYSCYHYADKEVSQTGKILSIARNAWYSPGVGIIQFDHADGFPRAGVVREQWQLVRAELH
jgi:hypothetical protein